MLRKLINSRFANILAAVAVTVLVVGTAFAGWDIVQKPDGSTVWQKEGAIVGGGRVQQPVGRFVLSIPFSSMQTAASKYIPVPATGVITQAYVTLDGNIGATTSIKLWVESNTNGTFTALTPTFVVNATQGIGYVTGLAFAATSPNIVRQNRSIAIESAGCSSCGSPTGFFTIVIDQ